MTSIDGDEAVMVGAVGFETGDLGGQGRRRGAGTEREFRPVGGTRPIDEAIFSRYSKRIDLNFQ
jgi:hypothetical protein